jgi:hypothetical protein
MSITNCPEYEKGTQIYEMMMTPLATWKQQELNTYDKMVESLTAAWSKW